VSSSQGPSDTIPIGYVRKAHGIRGDVLVRGLVGDADQRFVDGVGLASEEPPRTFAVVTATPHAGDYIIHLEGVDTRTDAEALVGTQFVIPRSERRTLDDDEWWVEDLVGCRVVDVDGTELATVTDVVTGAAQDRLAVVTVSGATGEIPFVDPLVLSVDVEQGRIVVDLPPGLLD
jgi:16S rRNA processing protein RimM